MTVPQNINILCKGTKAEIEAFPGLPEGSVAYATDTNELGTYNGTSWEWGGAGDMTKAVYDTDDNGIVDDSEKWAGFSLEAGTPDDGASPVWNNGDLTYKTGIRVRYSGTAPSTDNIVLFNDTSGNVIKDSGVSLSDLAPTFNDAEGDPAPVGTAADGTSIYPARRDHVHAMSVVSGRIFVPFGVFSAISPLSASNTPYAATVDRTMTFKNFSLCLSSSGNNSTNYWTITLARTIDGASIKTFDTKTFTYPSGYELYTTNTFSIASVGASNKGMYITCVKTGSPGNLYVFGPLLEVEV